MKKHPEHKIDELVRSSLQDLQGSVDSLDWTAIQAGLKKDKNIKSALFFNRKNMLALLFLMIAVSGSIYYYFPSEKIVNHEFYTTEKTSKKLHISTNEKMLIENKGEAKLETGSTKSKTIENSNGYLTGKYSHKRVAVKNKLNSETERNLTGKVIIDEPNVLHNSADLSGVISNDIYTEPTPDVLIEKNEKPTEIKNEKQVKKQQPKTKNTFKSKLSFGINFTPNYTGRSLEQNPEMNEQTHKNYYELRNNQETGSAGFNAGIFAQYNIWKGFNLSSGIEYMQISEKAEYRFYNNDIPVVDSASGRILGYININDSAGTSYSGTNTYNYATIPFSLGYDFPIAGKWSAGINIGGAAMFLISEKGKTLKHDDLTLTDVNSLRNTNWSIYISPAIYYRIQKYFSVGITPSYQYFINPVQQENAPVKSKPQTLGLGTVIRFHPF